MTSRSKTGRPGFKSRLWQHFFQLTVKLFELFSTQISAFPPLFSKIFIFFCCFQKKKSLQQKFCSFTSFQRNVLLLSIFSAEILLIQLFSAEYSEFSPLSSPNSAYSPLLQNFQPFHLLSAQISAVFRKKLF